MALEHSAQAVLVITGVGAALDLVVGDVGRRAVRLEAHRRQVNVAVHAALDAHLIVELRQVLHVRLALRGVEVGRRKWQVHVVDHDGEEAGAVARLVPRHLEILRAAERHLRHELLKLGAELLALHGELPVHERCLALRLLDLLNRDFALDQILCRTLRWQKLFDGACREVDARLGHHRVHDLRRAVELRAAGGVVAQTSAADAFFVLLVALLARLFVLADQFEELRRQ